MSARSVKTDTYWRLTSAQLEEQLVRKRQMEYERLNFWNNNSTYFKSWNFNTAQYSNWTSNEFYNNRLESLKKAETRRKKEEVLTERRRKLKELLEREDRNLEIELKNSTKKEEISVEDLKCANMEILLREEEKRRRERDLKLYHHWRQNQPLLRDFESKQHHDFVKKSWIQQVIEKKNERELEERKALEYLENMKKLREEQERIQREMEEERKKSEEELKLYLEKQMEMIKCKEEQEKILKREEMSIVKAQAELEELMEERRRVEERRKTRDISLFNRRQYLLMLKRRAQEVRDNIDADRKFLEKLAKDEEEIARDKSERMDVYKRELDLARKALAKEAEVEKLKMKQCEFMFEEEARRMLEKQNMQWKLQEEARNKLMNEVLQMRKLQEKEMLSYNLKQQEEIRKYNEIIRKKTEEAQREFNQYLSNGKAARDASVDLAIWKKELDHQALEKRMLMSQAKKKLEKEMEMALSAMRKKEEMLSWELSKMNINGYEPKDHRRRKFQPL